MSPILTKKRREHGFTLVEVAVVVPMIIVIVIGILSMLVILVRSNVVQSTRSSLVNDTRIALGSIEKDTDASDLFFPDTLPSATYKDFNEPGLTGTYKTYGTLASGASSTNLNTLFIQTYNQILDPQDTTNTKAIAAFKGASPCSATSMSSTNIAPMAALYFVKNGVLYRRIITDRTNPALCGTGPLVRQTCPTGSDANVPQCLRKDTALLDNVSQFKVDYYLNAYDVSALNAYVASPSPTIDQAKSILVTVSSSATASGTRVSHTVSLRVTRLNTN